jgi:predicted esterase
MQIVPGEVVFFHGLEGSPQGHKARWLRERWSASVPVFDNREVIALFGRGRVTPDALQAALQGPLRTAYEAITPQTRVVVGSSFGGLLAVLLMQQGVWSGPAVLLAPAVHRTGDMSLPQGVPIVVVHGRHDDIVPASAGQRLAASGGPTTMYWELDDGHALGSIRSSGVLDAALRWVWTAGSDPL